MEVGSAHLEGAGGGLERVGAVVVMGGGGGMEMQVEEVEKMVKGVGRRGRDGGGGEMGSEEAMVAVREAGMGWHGGDVRAIVGTADVGEAEVGGTVVTVGEVDVGEADVGGTVVGGTVVGRLMWGGRCGNCGEAVCGGACGGR
ncbi:hypothetical protein CYMTET_6002 [Cymbomonas tetramitiformis]|uniref:Uncharacterized protein n=1 Tax=Cymbomonas tetramitiformis TaxID=36881 RepID=A0AAE0H009_9CHLO|nr:hypothetical protein CYMTET_6002 [Cymbomonas tetramitiformis]